MRNATTNHDGASDSDGACEGLQLRRVACGDVKTTAMMEPGDDTTKATSNSEKTRSDNSGRSKASTNHDGME
jgi:hypothetical protein